MQKKIFITGASGCIGHYVLDALLLNPCYELHLIVRSPEKLRLGCASHPNIKVIKDNLVNIGRYKDLLREMDYVIHLAAGWGGNAAFDINCKYTLELLSLLESGRCEKVIYFSTASILDSMNHLLERAGRDGTSYINSKYLCYKSLSELKVFKRIITLFPTITLGGDERHPYSHVSSGLSANKKWVGVLRFLRFDGGFHFIHARDIGLIVKYVLEHETQGSNFVLGNPYITVDDFIKKACVCFGKKMYFRIGLSPAFLRLITRLAGKNFSAWDRFCLEYRHFKYNAVNAESFGIESDYKTVEGVLKDFMP